MLAVDTNLLVRILVKDDLDQALAARNLVLSTDVLVTMTVLLETEWVLRSAYQASKSDVIKKLRAFMGLETVKVRDPAAVRRAFDAAEAGLEFADAVHLAEAEGCEAFVTFDKALVRTAERAGLNMIVREP